MGNTEIEALKCCLSADEEHYNCAECPYNTVVNCRTNLQIEISKAFKSYDTQIEKYKQIIKFFLE